MHSAVLVFEFSSRFAYKDGVSEPSLPSINASTRFCAVYGYPVKHSASPAMQNAAIAALGLNWRYVAFEVHPDELRPALDGAKAMRFIGLNLTVPHKLLAVDMVDVLDESAQTWGAVNTVRFEGRDDRGAWRPLGEFEIVPGETRSKGFNTDADAITRALREDLGLDLHGKSALVLGVGGAGRAAALKLAADGISELYLINRTREKAEAAAEEILRRHPSTKATLGYPPGRVDLVLNATSLGFQQDDPLPFDEKQFSIGKAGAVYDMIYRPAETRLLGAAKAAGCRTANGLSMLLYQGAKALELWSGQAVPLEIMRKALEKNVYGSS
ncbi:MAG: shikimate dehydrogenase [Verrucomicrobiota bacterium]